MATVKKEVTPVEEVVEEKVAPKSGFKFYKSRLFGLKVIVNDQVADPTLVEYVHFTGVKEKFQGDTIKTGYIKTDNKIAIAKLEGDPMVEVITEAEYEKAIIK